MAWGSEMTIVSKDGAFIGWHIRTKDDLRFLLASSEERDQMMEEAFRQMLDVLRPTAQSEKTDDHRRDLMRVADGK
jgi:hypothetical protein